VYVYRRSEVEEIRSKPAAFRGSLKKKEQSDGDQGTRNL
jgi:hypothetical protein